MERSMVFSRTKTKKLEQNTAQPENNHTPVHSRTGFRVGKDVFLTQNCKRETCIKAKRDSCQDSQPGRVKLAPYLSPYLSRGHLAPLRYIDDLPLHRSNVSIYFLVLIWGAAGLAFV